MKLSFEVSEMRRVLDDLFEVGAGRVESLSAAADVLWGRTRRAVDGGKQLRPHLIVLSHHHLGGKHADAALLMAASIEVLHTAFLLHDDVIDGDWTRRGRPNLGGLYCLENEGRNSERIGVAAGVVGGDLALQIAAKALRKACRILPPHVADSVEEIYDDMVFTSAVGELADVVAEGIPPHNVRVAEDIAYAKTAAYTFEAPLLIGATLAEADPDIGSALRSFARNAGISYQIHDDILGIFGDETGSGKSVTSDLVRRKASFVLIRAQQVGAWAEVDHVLSEAGKGHDFVQARRLLKEAGCLQWCEELAWDHQQRAIQALHSVPASLRRSLLESCNDLWVPQLTSKGAGA